MPTDIHILPFEKRDLVETADLLTAVFLEEEPLTTHLAVSRDEFYLFARELCSFSADQSLSWILRSREGELLGLRLATRAQDDFHPDLLSPKMQSIFRLLEKVWEPVLKIDLGKYIHSQVMAVKKEFQGMGLAKMLIEQAKKHAAQQGFAFSLGEVTSSRNQKILMKSAGLRILNRIDLDLYTENGRKIFSGIPEHKESWLMELPLR